MMLRISLWLLFVLSLFLIETSFISSLPGIASVTPFVFASIVYLVQHQGLFSASWWLILYGVFIDVFHLGVLRFETIAVFVSAIVVWYAAKRLFSNRSYYGVIACGILGYFAIIVTEALILPLQHLFTKTDIDWGSFLSISVARLVTLVILITLIYPFAKRIRYLISQLFVFSSR